jgi:uncharacterized protein YndB with AHSA1/START domain
MTLAHTTVESVRKSVRVNAPRAHAFAVFTEHLGEWWPLHSYHIGTQPAQSAILESRAGGRWFERAADGTECDWGRVITWDPPDRLVVSWDIGADWKYQPELGTEVEVRFIAEGPETTRVELEHRRLERYAGKAADMRMRFDSEKGWSALLQLFAQAAATR